MKSIRTNPTTDAVQGDERIRTAVPAPSTDPAYEAFSAEDEVRFTRLLADSKSAQREADLAHRRLRAFHREMADKYPRLYLTVRLARAEADRG